MSNPWIRTTTNKLMELPRLPRREIEEILKEVYQRGKEEGRRLAQKDR